MRLQQQFDITKYEFSDSRLSFECDNLLITHQEWMCHTSGYAEVEIYADISKQDAIALAKHFKLTEGDLNG